MSTKRTLAFLGVGMIFLAASAPCSAQESLGEIARKYREKKKTASAATTKDNESIERPSFDFYPTVKASFALPKGWPKPTAEKNLVSVACPGVARGTDGERCTLAVGVDGPLPASYWTTVDTMLSLRGQFEKKAKNILEPWRDREVRGMPGGEMVFDGQSPARRARFVVFFDPSTRLVHMIALMAVPEIFETFAPALDTVIATIEPATKTLQVVIP